MKNVISIFILFFSFFVSAAQAAEADTDGNLTKDEWVSLTQKLHPDVSDRNHGHKNVLLATGYGKFEKGEGFFWALRSDEQGTLRWEFSKPLSLLVLTHKTWSEKFCDKADKCDRWAATDDMVARMVDGNRNEKLAMSVSTYY